jgi:hypothetical protein
MKSADLCGAVHHQSITDGRLASIRERPGGAASFKVLDRSQRRSTFPRERRTELGSERQIGRRAVAIRCGLRPRSSGTRSSSGAASTSTRRAAGVLAPFTRSDKARSKTSRSDRHS